MESKEMVMMRQAMSTARTWLNEAIVIVEDDEVLSKMSTTQKGVIIAALLNAASNDQIAMSTMNLASTIEAKVFNG